MESMNSYFEIDLKELLIDLWIRWKVFLCFGICGAILFAFNYLTEVNKPHVVLDETTYIDNQIISISNTMDEKSIDDIENLLVFMRNTEAIEKKANDSFLMKVSPEDAKAVSVIYSVVGGLQTNSDLIVAQYSDYIESEQFILELEGLMKTSSDESLGGVSLYSVDKSGIIKITVIVQKDFDQDLLIESINNLLEGLDFGEDNGSVVYELGTVDTDFSVEVAERQCEIEAIIDQKKKTIRETILSLPTTSQYYLAYRAKQEEVDVVPYFTYLKMTVPNTSADDTTSYLNIISLGKNVMAGLACGIVFAIVLYLIYCIASRKIRRLWGENSLPGKRVIGTIYANPGIYSNRAFYSSHAINIVKKNNTRSRLHGEKLAADALFELSSSDIEEVCVTRILAEGDEKNGIEQAVNEFVTSLRNINQEMTIDYLPISKQSLDDASIYERLNKLPKTVIVVATCGKTDKKYIQNLSDILSRKNIVSGTILVE